ncbi:hypothetical protein AADZ90_009715 [Aestuariibius sp. 2305UL40-4]
MRKTSLLLALALALALLTACTPARVVTKTGTTAVKATGAVVGGTAKAVF